MEISTGEAVQFWIVAPLTVIAALGVVTARRSVYSALCLAATMLLLAVLYIGQGAPFLGAVQIVVYTGAVMMLFLFVLMLVGVDSADSLVETIKGQRVAVAVAAIGFALVLAGGIGNAATNGFTGFGAISDPANPAYGGNVDGLAELIFIRYVWAFELTGALLITATIGAMVLAHKEKLGPALTQREVSIERFRSGDRVTPLPSPGVFARHNAVDLAAPLPDGSPAHLSVSRVLISRRVAAHHPDAIERIDELADAADTSETPGADGPGDGNGNGAGDSGNGRHR